MHAWGLLFNVYLVRGRTPYLPSKVPPMSSASATPTRSQDEVENQSHGNIRNLSVTQKEEGKNEGRRKTHEDGNSSPNLPDRVLFMLGTRAANQGSVWLQNPGRWGLITDKGSISTHYSPVGLSCLAC